MTDATYSLSPLGRSSHFRFWVTAEMKSFSVLLSFTSFSSHLQVNAALDEQAFAFAWGSMAKQVFPAELVNTLPDRKDRTLMEKIKLLGAANLNQADRQLVCFYFMFLNLL